MRQFTKDDVVHWKNNSVTKAVIATIDITIKVLEETILNIADGNIYKVGTLQGGRQILLDVKANLEDPNYEELLDSIVNENEVENEDSRNTSDTA